MLPEIIRGSIQCNGIKPTKTDIYTLAAEMVEVYGISGFKRAVYCALIQYDYNYDNYNNYNYHNNSIAEKVIVLLFLAAIYYTKE